MKDEEIEKMADDFVNAQEFTKVYGVARKAECGAFWKYGFLAGLKAGKPQWHNLEKDPNDLPDEGTYLVVWQNDKGYKEIFIMNYEEDDEEDLHWVDGDCENQDEYIIAWCEIPTFDKE